MLLPVIQHPWDLSPAEAIALQRELRGRVMLDDAPGPWHWVGGIDVGVKGGVARAAVVVMTLADLRPVEQRVVERPVTFPYIPGLLSFREAPAILEALSLLEHCPDVLLVDGQGYAHPRRLGIASHLGLWLNRPTVGCGKTLLCGTFAEPGPDRGDLAWLYDSGEIIGAALRTRRRVKPVFVSVGHKMRLTSAIDLVLRCGAGYRLPEPLRLAHHAASQVMGDER